MQWSLGELNAYPIWRRQLQAALDFCLLPFQTPVLLSLDKVKESLSVFGLMLALARSLNLEPLRYDEGVHFYMFHSMTLETVLSNS